MNNPPQKFAPIISSGGASEWSIWTDVLKEDVHSVSWGHVFHGSCIQQALKYKREWPNWKVQAFIA